MKFNRHALVLTTLLSVAVAPACNLDGQSQDGIDFESEGKPDPVTLPIDCPQSPDDRAGDDDFPGGKVLVGTRLYDPAEVFAPALDGERAPSGREAITADLVAVLLNLEVGAHISDDVLIAVANLDAWLIATEMASDDDTPPADPVAVATIHDYFDDLRPCYFEDSPVVAGDVETSNQ